MLLSRIFFLSCIGWALGVSAALFFNSRKFKELHKIWQNAIEAKDWETSDMCSALCKGMIDRMDVEIFLWPWNLSQWVIRSTGASVAGLRRRIRTRLLNTRT